MARTKKKAIKQGENLRVQTMEEWLAAGNKITVCPPGMRSEEVKEKFRVGRGRKSSKKKTD
jgi:hypothetical protein